MDTAKMLIDCQKRKKIISQYGLAKSLQIPTQRIYDYMAGRRNPDIYTLLQIANCLGICPVALIAEFEKEQAKSEIEQKFWADLKACTEKL